MKMKKNNKWRECGFEPTPPKGPEALTWRLRPLGHLAFIKANKNMEVGMCFNQFIEENNKGRKWRKKESSPTRIRTAVARFSEFSLEC